MSRRKDYWGPTSLPRVRRAFVRGMVEWIGKIEGERAADTPPTTEAGRTWWTNREAGLAATRNAAAKMDLAHLFWVTADMAQAAMDASHDIPSVRWAAVLPANAGMIGFATPLPPLPEDMQLSGHDGTAVVPKPIDAVSWHYGLNGLSIVAHTLASRYAPGEIPEEAAMPGPLMHTMAIITDAERELAFGGQTWGMHKGSAVFETAPTAVAQMPAGDALLAFLAACVTMMMQPTVATRTRLDGTTGGPAKPSTPAAPTDVTLIDLRPLIHKVTETEPGEGTRVYRHRWIVRGHWREQRVGQDRAERRTTWIPSYLKGPEGAPLLATEKVMVWRR